MALRDNLYSRVIAWLRILLPLAALVLLSTVFLLSRPSDRGAEVSFAEPGLGDRAARQQVTGPYFSGTTARGDVISLTARSVRPDPKDGNTAYAETLQMELGLTDGSRITLNADKATVDQTTNMVRLRGGVRIISTTGYDVATEELETALDQITLRTLAPVQGTGPAGRFAAGRMTVTTDAEGNNAQMLFTDGIKLVYDPKQ